MEPNTGVTFEDVAGVEEAKQDFMEVGAAALSTCGVGLLLLLPVWLVDSCVIVEVGGAAFITCVRVEDFAAATMPAFAQLCCRTSWR
jgi:hypothetical protein